MGHLSERQFAATLEAGCAACGAKKLELHSVIDQYIPVMVADVAGDAKWIHDGEKFVDGTYRITCTACKHVLFASDDCPRCHAAGALPAALAQPNRIKVPKKCPMCSENQLVVIAMVPSVTVFAGLGAKLTPKPLAELGDDGLHVVTVSCDDHGVIAGSGDACPICAGPGPLRPRP